MDGGVSTGMEGVMEWKHMNDPTTKQPTNN